LCSHAGVAVLVAGLLWWWFLMFDTKKKSSFALSPPPSLPWLFFLMTKLIQFLAYLKIVPEYFQVVFQALIRCGRFTFTHADNGGATMRIRGSTLSVKIHFLHWICMELLQISVCKRNIIAN
jgi:hypothetical protein